MTAQFSTVNQSRPEEITMKEDLTTISFVGDDNFGKGLNIPLVCLLSSEFTKEPNLTGPKSVASI